MRLAGRPQNQRRTSVKSSGKAASYLGQDILDRGLAIWVIGFHFPAVALEMGNSPGVIEKHYLEAVPQSAGEQWFETS